MPFNGLFRKAGDIWNGLTGQTTPPAPAPFAGPGGDPSGTGIGQAQQAVVPAITPSQQALGDTLSLAEGTWDPARAQPDYAVRFNEQPGGGSLDTSKPHPGTVIHTPGLSSDASGAYQFMSDTWQEMFDGVNAPMTPDNQVKALNKLAEIQGYDHDLGFAEQTPKLSGRWASIPNAEGVSDYNQPVHYSADELDRFFNERLERYKADLRKDVYNRSR